MLAFKLQHPEIKINHAIVLGGGMRIGKDTMLVPFKRALGSWNCYEARPTTIMGNFNPYMRSVLLMINETHDLGDEHNDLATASFLETFIDANPANPNRIPARILLGQALLAQNRLADLLASVRDIPSINPLAGITSGPGNQGSACRANLQGHAGTVGTYLGPPRSIARPGIEMRQRDAAAEPAPCRRQGRAHVAEDQPVRWRHALGMRRDLALADIDVAIP